MNLKQIAIIAVCVSSFAEISSANTIHETRKFLSVIGQQSTEEALLSMEPSQDPETEIERWFLLGQIYVEKGDFKTAIKIFRKILESQPSLARVRLELARALFFNKNYQDAETHFLFVRASPNLPPEVATKIDWFLAAIRQRKNWDISFSFGLVPDSNINVSGSAKEECVMTLFGTLCRPLETRKSGTGVSLDTEANYYLRFSDRFGLRTTVGVSVVDFATSEFDNNAIYVAVGPRYAFDRGEISLQALTNARWYGGEYYNQSYGARFDTSWQVFEHWMLDGGLSIQQNNYKQDYAKNALDGYEWDVYLMPRYFLNNRSFIMTSVSFEQTETEIKAYGTNSIGYSVGYFGELYAGFALFARVDLITNYYRDKGWFVIDKHFQEKQRQDLTWQFYVRLHNNRLAWHNLTPAISYTYIFNDSNIPNRDFDKHRLEFEIIRRF